MPTVRRSAPSGLAFRGLLGFLLSFAAARTFTTFYPEVVVETGGIHLHHFWYGLAIVLVAGWLGIASNRPQLERAYAFAFGLGTGLIGDELGLLLTFGDYHSMLTFEIAAVAVALALAAILAAKYGSELREDLLPSGKGERLVAAGIFVWAIAALPAASGIWAAATLLVVVGTVVAAIGVAIHWRYLSQA